MATDVHKLKPTNYSTNLTSPVSPPPYRDHKYNNNQTIRTITTKDQATNVPPDIPPSFSNTSNQDNFNKKTLEEQMQQYDEKYYNFFNNIDDDDGVIEIPHDMFDSDSTTETITHIPTMIEEEPNPLIINNTTTTGEEGEENRNMSDNATIDAKFTTSTTMEEEEEDEKSNNYYDNIDN